MLLIEKQTGENALGKRFSFEIRSDDNAVSMSHATVDLRQTRFAGNWVNTLLIAGVGTPVPYRRQGCVRLFLETLLPNAEKYDAAVSLLHPFSFSYYRKFGYERVSDTVIADFPITALDFLPRYADLVPMCEEKLPEVVSLFDRCMAKRNLTFRRAAAMNKFPFDGERQTYLYYAPDGHPAGYVMVEPQNHYDGINRMISDALVVWELVFEDRDALLHLLSFLRMYEGELDTVHLRDIGMTPEVDWVLKHYMHTTYDIHPDIMARVLDTEKMLRANTYPTTPGHFTLRVEDNLPRVAGTFRVDYADGACNVERLSDTAAADLTVGSAALSRLLYGCDAYNAELASYLDGVTMANAAEDFFRAFPKRINGLYEHF